MTNEQKQMFLDLSRKLISDSVSELQNDLNKISLFIDKNEEDEIFINCNQSVANIQSEINKIKKLIS